MLKKPIVAIRRKASSFRENSKLLKPKVDVAGDDANNKKSQFAAGEKRPPSIELDRYFSIDAFLHRIKPHRRRSTYEVSSSSSLPSIQQQNCYLDELPENCLTKIFSNLEPSNLQKLRIVCNRFDSIIKKSHLIPPTQLDRLQLNGNGRGVIYRFSLKSGPIYDRYGFHESEIDKGLKCVITKNIIFDNVFIDSTVSKALLNGINYEIEEIIFDFCHFQLSAFAFAQLLQNWKPKKVSIINCDWRDSIHSKTALIGDSFFQCNLQIETFLFSTVGVKKTLISDKTFQNFSSYNLPQSFELIGCETKITYEGIHQAVKAYFSSASKPQVSGASRPTKPFIWNFGRFYGTAAEILKNLKPFLSQSKIIKSNFPKFEIRFRPTRSFPVLSLSLVFYDFVDTLDSSYSMSDISWDDSEDENINN